jgi:hypothetical protein
MFSMDNLTLSLIISERMQDVDLASLSQADWESLIRKAQMQGVGPLVYWTLSRSGKLSSLPESVRNSLRAMYSSTWMQNQKILKELEIFAHLFNQAGIPVVVLKGVCFALTIYPDIGLRPMGDLDILVPGQKLTESARIARRLGYKDVEPEASPGLNDLLSHHVCLRKPGVSPLMVEIHDCLIAEKSFTYAVPVGWFWEQTEPLSGPLRAKYENLRMLTPAAQLLYGAAHAMLQHGGKKAPLRWFYDLDLLIRFYQKRLDWDLLLAQARRFEWGSALDAALSQTYKYFNTPIPDHVSCNLSKDSDRHQALVAYLQIPPATHVLEERQKLLSLNGYARVRLFLALLVPGPAYMRWRYQLNSSWALPAYYLVRWWGILKDAFHTLVILLVQRCRSANQ